jgi:serine/threonine protein kinase
LDEAVAATCIVTILDTLARMHGSGIFHRDIKTANILLRNADDVTSVVLADFTSCYVVPPRSENDVDVAAAGSALSTTIAGTPYYLAPEIGEFLALIFALEVD